MLGVVKTLAWIEFKTYLRNRTALFWTFVNPVFTMVILMLVFGGQERGLTLPVDVYVAQERSSAQIAAQDEIIQKLRQRPYLAVKELVTKPDRRGALGVGLTSQADGRFRLTRLYGEPSHFELFRTAVDAALLANGDGTTGSQGRSPLSIGDNAPAREAGSYGVYLTVGILTLTVISVCLFGFSVPLVELRSSGAGRMYQIFPMGSGTFMAAYVLSRIGVIVALGLFIVVFADLVYNLGFDLTSPLFLLNVLMICLFSAVAFISVGLLTASVAGTVATASAIVNILYLPLTLFSDIFLPLSLFPEPLAEVLRVLPLAQFVGGARAILIEGEPFWTQWPAFASLGLLALLCLVLARLKFSWRV